MKPDQKKKLRIKIIGILLCILATALSGCILFFLTRHILLLYLAGAASCIFFYRALFYKSPAERREQKEKKNRLREEYLRWKDHPFFPVCKRARAAYLILCLEEALKFYGQDLSQRKEALKTLWEVTNTRFIEDWVWQASELSAEAAFSCRGGDPTALETLEELMNCICDVIIEDWGEMETPNTPSALQHIDRAEQLLSGQTIPLPHDGQALEFLMSRRHRHDGAPFDGIQFSELAKIS